MTVPRIAALHFACRAIVAGIVALGLPHCGQLPHVDHAFLRSGHIGAGRERARSCAVVRSGCSGYSGCSVNRVFRLRRYTDVADAHQKLAAVGSGVAWLAGLAAGTDLI